MFPRIKHLKHLLFAGCFLMLSNHIIPQTKSIDSLLLMLTGTTTDTDKMKLNYELSDQLSSYNIQKADKFLEDGYLLAKKTNNIYYKAYYFKTKGGYLFDQTKYDQSGSHYDSAIALYNALIDENKKDAKKNELYKFGKTDCLLGKGLIEAKLYHYTQSNQYFTEAIAGLKNLGTKKMNILPTCMPT